MLYPVRPASVFLRAFSVHFLFSALIENADIFAGVSAFLVQCLLFSCFGSKVNNFSVDTGDRSKRIMSLLCTNKYLIAM